MSQTTDQIKERINVADFIREYLKLEKAGSNYKALCPFHNEKTPSFMVNPERNFWYCFGCQKGGDIFTFIQEIEGLDFREALERLAEKAGVELPRYTPQMREQKSEKQKLFEILELSTKVYEYQLENHAKGEKIKKYLSDRKITPELIKEFRLGYAPDSWRMILEYLSKKKGYAAKNILQTGLLVERAEEGKVYDRFRGRIMFPIIDVTGRVLGYSARVAPGGDESTAKYINTPETIVYNKSKVLYGLFQGKTEIKKQDFAIIVEGNADVIASHRAGFPNVVAVSGTALTDDQVRLLKRYTENVKLCFDMDEAGQKATRKSIQTCLKNGMEVEIILLPDGLKDAGDVVEKDPKEWRRLISEAVPVMEYFFQNASQKHNPEEVRDKKLIAKDLLAIIKDISDPIEQGYWLKKLSSLIDVDEEVLTNVLEKVKFKERRNERLNRGVKASERGDKRGEKELNKSRLTILEEQLLGLFFLYPNELYKKVEKMGFVLFGEGNDELFQKIFNKDELSEEEKNFLNKIFLRIRYSYDQKKGFIKRDVDVLGEWKVAVDELKKERKKMRLKKIEADIRRAEEENDEEAVQILLKELKELTS